MKNKYVKVFIIGVVLTILVAGAIFANDEELIQDVPFSLKSWFIHFFGLQDFSIVGDYRQCDRYPERTFTYEYGEAMYVDSADYCSSGYGLINFFTGGWNPVAEKRDSISISSCNVPPCHIEVYCCPFDECDSNSDCEDWYGAGSECIKSYEDDPNIAYEYDHFHYCTEPSGVQVTCWYYPGSGSSCSSRTYIGDEACPSTYMSYILYDSKSTCEGNIPTNGNGNGVVGAGDVRLDGDVQVWAPGYIDFQDYLTIFRIPLKNFGTETETINLEAGFYSPYYAKNVAQLYSVTPFFSVTTIPNCNPAEDFVKTKQVVLEPGETEMITIKVDAVQGLNTYNVGVTNVRTEPLTWFIGLYKDCLGGYINEAGTTGRGVMFEYGDYARRCDNIIGPIGTEVYCGTVDQVIGECKGYTLTLDAKCPIPSTIGVVNGTLDPYAKVSLIEAKKISLSKNVISTSTSADLLASSCLSSSECILPVGDEEDYNAKCISIANLRDKGILTEADTDNFFDNAKKIGTGTAIGAAAGITACLATGIATVISGGAALPITAPLLVGCGVAGGLLGGSGVSIILELAQDDNLLKELNAENANAVGICVKESKSGLDNLFSWAAWFDVTGDGTKDGTDGLIIVIVLGALLLVILKK